jgi:hypothetical protein
MSASSSRARPRRPLGRRSTAIVIGAFSVARAQPAAAAAAQEAAQYFTQADMQDTDSLQIKEDHAVNSKLSPLDASQPSARRWNLGPPQGERPQLAGGEAL